jgi:hypothetical protein
VPRKPPSPLTRLPGLPRAAVNRILELVEAEIESPELMGRLTDARAETRALMRALRQDHPLAPLPREEFQRSLQRWLGAVEMALAIARRTLASPAQPPARAPPLTRIPIVEGTVKPAARGARRRRPSKRAPSVRRRGPAQG